MSAIEAFKGWAIMEETFWRQRSREIWLKERDRNTRYFHRMANSDMRRNQIRRLRINGVWATEDSDLKSNIVNAFKSLRSDPGYWRASPDGLSFSSIIALEASRLELPFIEAEVYSALCELNGDKAPGSDGFTVSLWQFSWTVVKEEVLRMSREFFETRRFIKNLNTTFIVMIPKKGGAEDLKDFRPISLVGSLYKLLAKVLANILKGVMGSLINKAQNAFVGGRQILDASLIANEVINSMIKKKEKGILCKLDIKI